MTTETRRMRIVPLTRVIGGRLCFLVLGSLAAGRPSYQPDEALERAALKQAKESEVR